MLQKLGAKAVKGVANVVRSTGMSTTRHCFVVFHQPKMPQAMKKYQAK